MEDQTRTTVIAAVIGAVGLVAAAFITVRCPSKPAAQLNTDSTPANVTHSSPPRAQAENETEIDFSSVDLVHVPGHLVAAGPYLADRGISVVNVVPPESRLALINNLAIYDGVSVHPTTSQNFLTQIDTGNVPASFTLVLKRPCRQFSFTRPTLLAATGSGITHPSWSAHALDADGQELSAQSEMLTRSLETVPARTYALTSPAFEKIAAVRFDSDPRLNGRPFAGFSAILLERLTLGLDAKE